MDGRWEELRVFWYGRRLRVAERIDGTRALAEVENAVGEPDHVESIPLVWWTDDFGLLISDADC